MLTFATIVASAIDRSRTITVSFSSVVVVHVVVFPAAAGILSRKRFTSELVVRGTAGVGRSRLVAPLASVDGSHVWTVSV
jgi:hypothetical protein